MRILKTLGAAAPLIPMLVVLAVLDACPAARAQKGDVQRPVARGQGQIFKGRGDDRRRGAENEMPAPPPPPRITAAQIGDFLQGFKLPPPPPGSTYVTLSITAPFVANKGHLGFQEAHAIVTGGNFFGFWPPKQQVAGAETGHMSIALKSEAAGRRYLFDCAVRPMNNLYEPYRVTGPGLEQTFAAVSLQGQHLMFVLETDDAEWYRFYISRKGGWYAYTCEVTNL